MNTPPPPSLLAGWTLVVLSALLLALSLWLICWLGLRFFRLLTRNSTVYGLDARARLLGLSVAVLLFPSTVGRFVSAWLSFLLGLFTEAQSATRAAWEVGVLSRACKGAGDCVAQTWFAILGSASQTVNRAFQVADVKTLPWAPLILFFAAWALATSLLNTVADGPAKARKESLGWLRATLAGTTDVTRKNALFFLILAVGVYLSIAAITAIPDLRVIADSTTPEGITVKGLTDRLDKAPAEFADAPNEPPAMKELERLLATADTTAMGANSPGNAVPPAAPARPPAAAGSPTDTATGQTRAPQNDSLSRTRSMVSLRADSTAQTDSTAAALVRDSLPATVGPANRFAVRRAIDEFRRGRDRLLREHAELISASRRRQADAREQAVDAYELTNANYKSERVKTAHFLAVATWFSNLSSALQARAEFSRNRISTFDGVVARWAGDMRGRLLGGRIDPIDLNSEISRASIEAYNLPLPDEAQFEALERPVPERPQSGSTMGPFRFVSQWLLDTESLPLALITGMLGFGLLGAAASTFVREQVRRTRRPKQPLVADLPGVVIRGGSAAIVVFLAVMGGLAVFSARDAEPNPYVLLFTCLVGAVFSERVWTWAEENLAHTLTSREDDADDASEGEGDDESGGKGRLGRLRVRLPKRIRPAVGSPPLSPPAGDDGSPPADGDMEI